MDPFQGYTALGTHNTVYHIAEGREVQNPRIVYICVCTAIEKTHALIKSLASRTELLKFERNVFRTLLHIAYTKVPQGKAVYMIRHIKFKARRCTYNYPHGKAVYIQLSCWIYRYFISVQL